MIVDPTAVPEFGGATGSRPFKLCGEPFSATTDIDVRLYRQLGAAQRSEDATAQTEALVGFVRSVLATDDDKARFDALMADDSRIVGLRAVADLVKWLSEGLSVGGAPLERSSQPSSGRLVTSYTSEADWPSSDDLTRSIRLATG